jgi:hypothetical protein
MVDVRELVSTAMVRIEDTGRDVKSATEATVPFEATATSGTIE